MLHPEEPAMDLVIRSASQAEPDRDHFSFRWLSHRHARGTNGGGSAGGFIKTIRSNL